MAITILWAQLFFILLYILSPFVFVAFSFNNSVCLLIHSFVHSIYTFLRLFQWKCIEPKSCIPTNKVKRFALFANVYTILELHRLCTHGSCAHEMNRVASSLGGGVFDTKSVQSKSHYFIPMCIMTINIHWNVSDTKHLPNKFVLVRLFIPLSFCPFQLSFLLLCICNLLFCYPVFHFKYHWSVYTFTLPTNS